MVFAFADTLIDLGGRDPQNCALLDPPRLFSSGNWTDNPNPTTAFRHRDGAQAVHVDGHADRFGPASARLVSTRFQIGSVGADNDPHYVPDWREWTAP
jgi:hypothetical protein